MKTNELKIVCFLLSLLNDYVLQARNFFSTIGLDGFMLTTICTGMSPVGSFRQLFVEVLLMGPLRLVGAGYLFFFQRIIEKYKHCTNPETSKKST